LIQSDSVISGGIIQVVKNRIIKIETSIGKWIDQARAAGSSHDFVDRVTLPHDLFYIFNVQTTTNM
jgi:hypothetical protein